MLIFPNHQNIFPIPPLDSKQIIKYLNQYHFCVLVFKQQIKRSIDINYCTYYTYMIEESASISNEPQVQKTPKSSKKQVAIDQTSDQHKEFSQDDIVWAKIVGYPWWPAVITEKRHPKYTYDEENHSFVKKQVVYRVDFFGDTSHAFLQQAKIADYLPNKSYFVEMAQKQTKKFNYDHFRASLKIADLMTKDPFEVSENETLPTPKKEKIIVEEKPQNNYELSLQRKNKNKINENSRQKQELNLILNVTQEHKKLSKFLLRLLIQKNEKKYSLKILKQVIIKSFKKEKCVKKMLQQHSQQISKWVKSLQSMNIEQIILKYHPQAIKNITPHKLTNSYIYIDELGNKSSLSEPLQRCDFYIDL